MYSPKTYDVDVVASVITAIGSSPKILVTKEFGTNNTHEHANFLFYHSSRDAYNVRRSFKWQPPEWVVKAAPSPNNVVRYMTKEGTPFIILA